MRRVLLIRELRGLIVLELEQTIHSAVANRHRNVAPANLYDGNALLGAERETLDDTHFQAATRSDPRREHPKCLQCEAE
jgi:hypothetical protein